MTEKFDLQAFLPVADLDANGHYAAVQLADGRWACIEPQTFQRARVGISHAAGATAREALAAGFGYAVVWDFDELLLAERAVVAIAAGGEPEGWTRKHGGDARAIVIRAEGK